MQRSKGRSSTAAAAYRAGEKITDERTNIEHDYTKKRGVEHTEIVTPIGMPTPTRAQLWNRAEAAERRKDGTPAREYEVALPSELSSHQRKELAMDFARTMAERHGVAVDVCIHAPNREGDERNHHAHILTTTRQIERDGSLSAKADIEKAGRNRRGDLADTRRLWADLTNQHLERAGIDARVDHRTLKDQGADRIPTQKMGWKATSMERQGIATDRGDANRSVKNDNEEIHGLRLEIVKQRGLQAVSIMRGQTQSDQVNPVPGRDVASRFSSGLEEYKKRREQQRAQELREQQHAKASTHKKTKNRDRGMER